MFQSPSPTLRGQRQSVSLRNPPAGGHQLGEGGKQRWVNHHLLTDIDTNQKSRSVSTRKPQSFAAESLVSIWFSFRFKLIAAVKELPAAVKVACRSERSCMMIMNVETYHCLYHDIYHDYRTKYGLTISMCCKVHVQWSLQFKTSPFQTIPRFLRPAIIDTTLYVFSFNVLSF